MSNGVTAWSPSRLVDYETCAAKFRYKVIERLPDPGSEAMDRGTRIHAEAERYIQGVTPARQFPPDLKRVRRELGRMRKAFKRGVLLVEQSLAFDDRWRPVDWFSKSAWLRLKIDAVETDTTGPKWKRVRSALVTDWKTGQNRPSDSDKHGDQLNLYSVGLLSADLAERSTARLIFTDSGEVVQKPQGALDLEGVELARKTWERRVAPLFTDKKMVPTPNFTCRWCAFSKAKGGPCRF